MSDIMDSHQGGFWDAGAKVENPTELSRQFLRRKKKREFLEAEAVGI